MTPVNSPFATSQHGGVLEAESILDGWKRGALNSPGKGSGTDAMLRQASSMFNE